jgi:hypothetical protein
MDSRRVHGVVSLNVGCTLDRDELFEGIEAEPQA